MTSVALLSSQPSAIQAGEATMNSASPATITLAFQLAATSAAAMIVGAAERSQQYYCVHLTL
jgi:hypothetical protein